MDSKIVSSEKMYKPTTFTKVQKDLHFLPYDLQMFCYHKLNGREEEANSYKLAHDMERAKARDELKAREEPELLESGGEHKE